jgi:copper chaperone CopZ
MTSPSPAPSPSQHPADPAVDPRPAGGASTTVHLAVDGMHCDACVALIEESLTEQAGVGSASVDLASARAVVAYDPSVIGVDGLCATVGEAGYTATPVG